MIIVKLGGSLLSSPDLNKYLQLAEQNGKGRLVIVPGGGVFADQVRLMQQRWKYSDITAHHMAILAMQQMALLFNGLCSNLRLVSEAASIPDVLRRCQAVVWSPLLSELDDAGLAASWDVTSDSLAAWLALRLSAARLVLVKSARIPDDATLDQLTNEGIIDPAFTAMVADQSLQIDCIHYQQYNAFASSLIHYV